MQEEPDGNLMHLEVFKERQGFANEAAQALTQGVVETLIGWVSLLEYATRYCLAGRTL